MSLAGKVSITITRKKSDEQTERKAEEFLHWIGSSNQPTGFKSQVSTAQVIARRESMNYCHAEDIELVLRS